MAVLRAAGPAVRPGGNDLGALLGTECLSARVEINNIAGAPFCLGEEIVELGAELSRTMRATAMDLLQDRGMAALPRPPEPRPARHGATLRRRFGPPGSDPGKMPAMRPEDRDLTHQGFGHTPSHFGPPNV